VIANSKAIEKFSDFCLFLFVAQDYSVWLFISAKRKAIIPVISN